MAMAQWEIDEVTELSDFMLRWLEAITKDGVPEDRIVFLEAAILGMLLTRRQRRPKYQAPPTFREFKSKKKKEKS